MDASWYNCQDAHTAGTVAKLSVAVLLPSCHHRQADTIAELHMTETKTNPTRTITKAQYNLGVMGLLPHSHDGIYSEHNIQGTKMPVMTPFNGTV